MCNAAPLSKPCLCAASLLPAELRGVTRCSVPIPVRPAAACAQHWKHQAVPCQAQAEGEHVQEAGHNRVQEDVADMEGQGIQVIPAAVMQAVDFLPANPCAHHSGSLASTDSYSKVCGIWLSCSCVTCNPAPGGTAYISKLHSQSGAVASGTRL